MDISDEYIFEQSIAQTIDQSIAQTMDQSIAQTMDQSLVSALSENSYSLIQEQNDEYERCLKADIEIQIRRQEEQELCWIQEQSWIEEIDRKRESIRNEPPTGGINILFRIHIADKDRNIKIMRRFHTDDTVKTLYDFIEVQTFIAMDMQIEIYTNRPRNLLLRSSKSLQEEMHGVANMMLYVECKKEES